MNIKSYITDFLTHYQARLKRVLFLFVLGGVIGVVTAFVYPSFIQNILDTFSDKFGPDPALNLKLVFGIFEQNLIVSIIAWIGGLVLALPPILIVLSNGFILGYVIAFIASAFSSPGHTFVFLSAGLLPHAIFELPAFLIAAALGMSIGLDWLKLGSRGQRLKVLGQSFKRSAKYFLIVLILLLIAAFIEVYVSGHLVDKLS